MVRARVWVPARATLRGTDYISSGDRPDFEEVTKQAFPTTGGGLVGLNQPAVNALSELRWQYMHISYCQVQGSRYNTSTRNNVSICPGGAKRPNSHKKKYRLDWYGTFSGIWRTWWSGLFLEVQIQNIIKFCWTSFLIRGPLIMVIVWKFAQSFLSL